MREIAADDPARAGGIAGGEAQFLRHAADVAVEEGAGVGETGGVPVIILPPAEMIVAGDAGQLRPAEVEGDRGARALGIVVAERLLVRPDAGRGLEHGRAAPAGRAVARIRRHPDRRRAVRKGQRLEQVEPGRIGAVAAVMSLQQHVERAALVGELAAHTGAVGVAERAAGGPVVLEAAALLRPCCDPRREAVAERPRDVALAAEQAEAAVIGVHAQREPVGRLAGDESDRAGGRVAAVERALRPAQHLDPSEVEQQALRLDREGLGHLVDIDTDRRGVVGGIVVEADAAQPEVGLAAAERRHRLQPRRLVLELVDVGDAALGERLAADDGDGDRHRLNRGGAALGGDDDLGERGVGRGRHLRERRGGERG